MSYQKICHDINYAQFLGIVVDEKKGEFCLEPRADMIGNYMINAVHGGIISSLLEIAAGVTVAQNLGLFIVPKIIDLNFNFLRPAIFPHKIFAKADLFKSGQRVIHIEALAYLEDANKVIAKLDANYLTPS